jgi:hypothetical protein
MSDRIYYFFAGPFLSQREKAAVEKRYTISLQFLGLIQVEKRIGISMIPICPRKKAAVEKRYNIPTSTYG